VSPGRLVELRTTRLGCVVASAAVIGTAVVVIGAKTPGYSPMAETVSRLGSAGQPYASWMRAVFVLYGLLVLVGAAPLGEYAPSKERLLASAIGGYAAAAVAAGLAPKDPPQGVHTVASQVHVAATIVGGVMILVAMALVAHFASRRADRGTAIALGALTAVGVVVFRFSWGSAHYGLLERSFLALPVVWLAALAARLLASSRNLRASSTCTR
jgi:hypothetical membrane protein